MTLNTIFRVLLHFNSKEDIHFTTSRPIRGCHTGTRGIPSRQDKDHTSNNRSPLHRTTYAKPPPKTAHASTWCSRSSPSPLTKFAAFLSILSISLEWSRPEHGSEASEAPTSQCRFGSHFDVFHNFRLTLIIFQLRSVGSRTLCRGHGKLAMKFLCLRLAEVSSVPFAGRSTLGGWNFSEFGEGIRF